MNFNLSYYQIFYAAAQSGNFSKAAKSLYITQPAVSKAVTRLEEELHTVLFARSSKGVCLTEEGRILYQYAEKAFRSLEQGEAVLERMAELEAGHLRIGVSATLCKYMLLPRLKDFIEKYPHIKVTISCQSTFQTVSLLDQGRLDIGLIGKPETLRNLVYYPAAVIEDTFVAAESYLKSLGPGENDADYLNHATLMLLDEKNITRQHIERYLEKYRIEAGQILEVSSMDLLIDFARIGMGVACVIKEFVMEELKQGNLKELPLPAPIPRREVGFAYAQSAYITGAMKKFISFINGSP